MSVNSDRQLYTLYFQYGQYLATRGEAAAAADVFALAMYYGRRMGDNTLVARCRGLVAKHNPDHAANNDIAAPLFFAQLLIRYPADEVQGRLQTLQTMSATSTASTTAAAPETAAAKVQAMTGRARTADTPMHASSAPPATSSAEPTVLQLMASFFQSSTATSTSTSSSDQPEPSPSTAPTNNTRPTPTLATAAVASPTISSVASAPGSSLEKSGSGFAEVPNVLEVGADWDAVPPVTHLSDAASSTAVGFPTASVKSATTMAYPSTQPDGQVSDTAVASGTTSKPAPLATPLYPTSMPPTISQWPNYVMGQFPLATPNHSANSTQNVTQGPTMTANQPQPTAPAQPYQPTAPVGMPMPTPATPTMLASGPTEPTVPAFLQNYNPTGPAAAHAAPAVGVAPGPGLHTTPARTGIPVHGPIAAIHSHHVYDLGMVESNQRVQSLRTAEQTLVRPVRKKKRRSGPTFFQMFVNLFALVAILLSVTVAGVVGYKVYPSVANSTVGQNVAQFFKEIGADQWGTQIKSGWDALMHPTSDTTATPDDAAPVYVQQGAPASSESSQAMPTLPAAPVQDKPAPAAELAGSSPPLSLDGDAQQKRETTMPPTIPDLLPPSQAEVPMLGMEPSHPTR